MTKVELPQKTSRFRYSRKILFLPAILLFLFVTANSVSDDFVQATRKALCFALIASILIGILFLPNGLIHKPSPYLWKAIGGASFFYLSVLIYFLYLNKQSALHILKTYFDPSLTNLNYNQVSYAQDCRIYASEKQNPWGNISHSFFDLFAIAHALGWFFKTLVCRDLKLIMFSSIAFELVEYSLRDTLNNFKQCWWDHVIVDVFGCNLLGIVIGFMFIDYFGLQRYKWSLRTAPMQNSVWFNIKYFWTNWNLHHLQTKAFASLKKFLQMTWFVLFIQINDLALFFLKYIYQIPTNNYMILFRTFLIGFLCMNAAKQYYKFISQKQRQIKINCFMVNMIVLTQWFIVYKHGKSKLFYYIYINLDDFNHAFISPLGQIFLIGLFLFFLLFFIKISISDMINFKINYLYGQNSQKETVNKNIKDFSLFHGITYIQEHKQPVKKENISLSQTAIKIKHN